MGSNGARRPVLIKIRVPFAQRLSSNQGLKTALLISIGSATLWAQIGGYPPGGYPPGGYPGGYPGRYPGSGGPGIPMPRRSKKTTTADQKSPEKQSLELAGLVHKLDDKSLELASVDTRIITIEVSEKTVMPKGLRTGDPVRVEATQDNDGAYHALSVKIDREVAKQMPKDPFPVETQSETPAGAPAGTPTESEPEPRATTLVKSGPLYEEGDSGPPKLKRGKPQDYTKMRTPAASAPERPSPEADSSSTVSITPPTPPAPDARQELIEKAKGASASFLQSLPNYVCQQMTTRYQSESKASWRALDIVSAEMIYEDGKESYRNLQINGKATKKSPQESGAWSTGEFGTILADIFSPATAADFHFMRDASISGLASSIYDFTVERSNSHWKISLPAEFIQPAYKGSIWVDKKSGRVLRIEMQAREIPKDFPEDAIETAVDYQFVSLGTPEKFLLPVHAEVLACFRGTSACEKNVIDFRNYHKFAGESTIKYQ